MTQVSQSGGMIIQHYHMLMEDRQGVLYEGTTYFGFFTADALATRLAFATQMFISQVTKKLLVRNMAKPSR